MLAVMKDKMVEEPKEQERQNGDGGQWAVKEKFILGVTEMCLLHTV